MFILLPRKGSQDNLEEKVLIRTINTKVVGVTFACAKDEDIQRQDPIKQIYSLKTKIHLEPYEYEGEPANYVILDKKGLDIGNIKATLSKRLYEEYSGCYFNARITELTGDDEYHRTAGCKIAIDIYKDKDQPENTPG